MEIFIENKYDFVGFCSSDPYQRALARFWSKFIDDKVTQHFKNLLSFHDLCWFVSKTSRWNLYMWNLSGVEYICEIFEYVRELKSQQPTMIFFNVSTFCKTILVIWNFMESYTMTLGEILFYFTIFIWGGGILSRICFYITRSKFCLS